MKKLARAAILALSMNVAAKVRGDDGKGDATFRVNGKLVTVLQAKIAAEHGETVEKCKVKDPKGDKTTYAEDGTPLGRVTECTKQDYVINPKTGAANWKKAK